MNAFPIYGLNHGAAGSAFVLLLTLIFLAKLKQEKRYSKKKGKFKISNVTCKAQARNAWHGARLSLSLAVAEDSLASAKLELRSALRSAFAIFDGCRRLASPRLLRLKRPRTSLRRYPAKLGFGGRPAFGSVGGPGCVAFRHEGKGRNLFWSCASFAGFRKGREWLLEGAFTAGFMNPRRKVPWNLLYDLKGGVFNG